MKEFMLSASIILIIAVLCVLSLNFTNNMCSDMNKRLDDCSKKVFESDWNGASKILDNIHKDYDKKLPILKTFFDHKELFEIQNLLIKIKTAISVRNAEISVSEINTLISDLNTLSISEIPDLSNII